MLLPPGIAFGLFAALTFGLSDFLSALISRRLGTLYTLLGVQVVGVVLFLVYFLRTGEVFHLHVSSLPMALLIGAGLALLDSLAYFSFYTGLAIGPIAVVSPITASCAVVTVLLAASVGELPNFWQGVGICSTLGGVILVSLNSSVLSKPAWYTFTSPSHGKAVLSATWQRIAQRKSDSFFAGLAMIGFGFHLFFLSKWIQIMDPRAADFFIRMFSALLLGVVAAFFRREALPRRFTFKSLAAISLLGILDKAVLSATWQRIAQRKSASFFAGLAMIGFGFHLFFLSKWTQVVGPLAAVFFIRVFSALLLGVVAAFFRREALPRRFTFKNLIAISLLGILDTVGLLAYSAGTMRALTSVVTTLESSYSLIPICLGILIFRERLVRVQGLGIVAILLGLGLLTGLHS